MNGTGKWYSIAISAQGAILPLILSFGLTQWSAMHTRINTVDVLIASLTESVKQVAVLAHEVRQEQVQRTVRFADLEKQIIALRYAIEALNEKLSPHKEKRP